MRCAPMAIRASKQTVLRGLDEASLADALRHQADYPAFAGAAATSSLLIRRRTSRSLTRTVRHRSPMRARARCACTRLAAADLKRVTSGGSSLGNALPRSLRRPLFEVDWPIVRLG